MNSILLLLVGSILLVLGITKQTDVMLVGIKESYPGYPDIDTSKFFIGVLGVSVPGFILSQYDESTAWKYTILIIIMYLIFNYAGIEKFTKDIRSL